MLTRPLNDIRCLTLLLLTALERVRDPDVQALARNHGSVAEYVRELRSRPQLDDAPDVLPHAPRIGCVPPQRTRFLSENPNCWERTSDFLTFAEILDPGTARTAATLRIGGLAHTFPVEHSDDGPVPVILDPYEQAEPKISPNLTYAAVAHLLGYGPGQPAPMSEPLAWAEQVAAREGVELRNSSDLLEIAERYADVYPGGRQGLSQLAGRVFRPVTKVLEDVAETGASVAKTGIEIGSKQLKKHPRLGELLRSAIIGYGGPFAVVAIDVVENRLNKRGYTLGSLAESRDADVFAFH